jgi:hypothetical protein
MILKYYDFMHLTTYKQNKTSNNTLAPTVETGIQSVDIRFRNFRFFTMHLI